MTDHTEAVTRARALADQMYGDEAYDAIRDLLAFMDECGDAEKVYDAWLDAECEATSQRKRAVAAEAELEEVRVRANGMNGDLTVHMMKRHEAEAERDRLREALTEQTKATMEAAAAGPNHLMQLQLEAVVAERDQLRAEIELAHLALGDDDVAGSTVDDGIDQLRNDRDNWRALHQRQADCGDQLRAAVERVRELAFAGIRDGRGQAPQLGRALLAALDGPAEDTEPGDQS